MVRAAWPLPRPSARSLALLVVAVLAVGAVGGVLLARSKRPSPAGALAAVPHDAWLVAVVDVASLRASPIAKTAFGAGSSTLVPGVGSVVELCGFDPIARLREVVVASPEGGDPGDFGLAFTGEFSKGELAACAEKVIRSRLGQPSTTARGSFALIEDDAARAGGQHLARVAYREGGPFVVGRGAWLDAMIDAVDGKVERERPEHAALRDALSKSAAGARTVLVTAVLPKGLRERLKSEMAGELAGGGTAAQAQEAYAGVLGVEQAGLSIGTGGPASSTDIAAELRCETPSDCEAVRDLLQQKRLALSRNLGVRIIGLGGLLDSFAVEVRGRSLSASAHASTDDLARAVERTTSLLSTRRPPAAPPERNPGRDASPEGTP